MTQEKNKSPILDEVKYKSGKLTIKEKSFIKQNSGNLTIPQMSKKLQRTASIIESYLQEAGSSGLYTSEVLETLRKGYEYDILKAELSDKEIKIFEKRYSELVGQFKDDITASEKSQIFNLLKVEAMMSKTMQRNKIIEENMAENEADIKRLRESELPDDVRQRRITELRQYRQDSYGHYNANVRVFQELNKQHMQATEELKGSRKQRITKDEGQKNTFLGLMKAMKDDAQREKMGEDAELEKLASQAEEERYSSTTTYLDGTVDVPFVSGKI